MSEAIAVQPTETLLAENAAILSRFQSDGVEIQKATEFEFVVEFSSKQRAVDFRAAVRPVIKATRERYGLAGDLFVLCSDDEEARYEVRMYQTMVPDAERISALEAALASLATEFEGGDVSWEFADPRNSEVDA